MDVKEIARLINKCSDAVSKSTFGPIFTISNDLTKKGFNQASFSIFNMLLSKALMEVKLKEEAKEQ